MMTLRQQAVQLVNQLPEDQVPNIIHSRTGNCSAESEGSIFPKTKAFGELVKMVKPVSGVDYRKELEDARDKKYGYPN